MLPRFFFDIADGRSAPDRDGVEFLNIDLASAYASGIVSTFSAAQASPPPARVIVKNESGSTVDIVVPPDPEDQIDNESLQVDICD